MTRAVERAPAAAPSDWLEIADRAFIQRVRPGVVALVAWCNGEGWSAGFWHVRADGACQFNPAGVHDLRGLAEDATRAAVAAHGRPS